MYFTHTHTHTTSIQTCSSETKSKKQKGKEKSGGRRVDYPSIITASKKHLSADSTNNQALPTLSIRGLWRNWWICYDSSWWQLNGWQLRKASHLTGEGETAVDWLMEKQKESEEVSHNATWWDLSQTELMQQAFHLFYLTCLMMSRAQHRGSKTLAYIEM